MKTTSAPAVMAPARTSRAPNQSTAAVPMATSPVTTGPSNDLTRRAYSAASTLSTLFASSRWRSNAPCANALTTRMAPSPSCTIETISLWRLRTSRVASLTTTGAGRRTPEQRRDGKRHQRESPVEREHHRQHPDKRQRVDDNVEERRGREVLHRVDVVRDCADERPDLMAVVIGHRQPLQVRIHVVTESCAIHWPMLTV